MHPTILGAMLEVPTTGELATAATVDLMEAAGITEGYFSDERISDQERCL
jgi:hypothetical protein